MIYIGIDPGKNGGIAVINDSDNSVDTYTFSEERIVAECFFKKSFAFIFFTSQI